MYTAKQPGRVQLFFRLMAVAVALHSVACSTAAGQSTRQIQAALKDFGYELGAVDGALGPKTEAAVQRFLKETGLPAIDDPAALQMLGLGVIDGGESIAPMAWILLTAKPAERLRTELQNMSAAEVISDLPELASVSSKFFDLDDVGVASVISIIASPLRTGSSVTTYHSNIIDGQNNGWFQKYSYTIDSDRYLTVIINEFEFGRPMFLVNKLYIDSEPVAVTYTRIIQ